MANKIVVPSLIVLLLAALACVGSGSVPTPLMPEPLAEPALMPEKYFPPSTLLDDYLAENIGVAGFGGNVFCAYDLMGMNLQAEKPSLYLWALCQEYYIIDQDLDKGSGISVPVAIYLQKSGDGYIISAHELPVDGEGYGPSIWRLFPENLWPQIFPNQDDNYAAYNQRAERLDNATEQAAKIHFLLNHGIQSWIWPEY